MKIQKPAASSQVAPLPSVSTDQSQVAPKKISDQLVSSNQGAQVSVPQQQNEQGVGRPNGGSHTTPAQHPNLSAEELTAIGKVGSAGLKGRGEIKGSIKLEKGKAFLITANKGSRSEVKFALDLTTKQAKGLAGKEVSVSGMIDKKSPYGGKITGAKVATAIGGETAKIGDHRTVSGSIVNRNIMAIGGEAPPSGSYLVLDKPLKIDGKQVKEVFIRGAEMKEGEKVELYGRLDNQSFGGVETHGGSVVVLSGVSNVGAGEPKFDGKDFISTLGKKLMVLTDPRPSFHDAPAHLFVLDEGHDTAFFGRSGGHIPPTVNPFHGFVGSGKIEEPKDSDKGQVTFDAEGKAFNKAGKELYLVGEEPGGNHPDAMSRRWFLDDDSKTIYRFESGGIAGFNNALFSVIRLGDE